MTHGRYARVYYDAIAIDEKFEGIRHDRDLMGSWLLLLIEAEKAWPAPAFRPPTSWVPAKHVSKFSERGIIDLDPDGRFVMHGLNAERQSRSDKARDAATQRWNRATSNAPSSADAVPVAMPEAMPYTRTRVVSSVSLGTSLGEGGVGGDDGRADLEAFLAVRYRLPTPAQRRFMDSYLQTFDVTGPERAAKLILANPDDPIGALKADLTAFRQERVAQLTEKVAAPRHEKGSGLSPVNAELASLMSVSPGLLTAAHNSGAHADTPDPRCRYCRERGDAA